MYGSFYGNSQKCTESGFRTSVHDDFNPCTDKCKSVHGNPYIRTFYGDYCIKMAFFLPFFRIFFVFYQFFPNFRASRKFTIYILNRLARFAVLMTTAENLQGKRKEICKEVLNLNEKLNTYMLNKPKKDD